jgi:L-sorbose 1-phosphate reductase
MKTKAVRLYGKMDLRLEEFELPPIKEDEILVKVIADSLCMSTYKAAVLGTDHKRVPNDAGTNPIMVGHEMAGEIIEVGPKWQEKYKVGDKFSLQPALNYQGSMDSPGYSYKYCGGDTLYAIMPPEVMIMDCLLPFKGEGFFKAALSEPFSCTIGACRSLYRTDRHRHVHYLGIKDGGRMAIVGGCGPMGLAALDYALSGEFRPKQLIVTDLDNDRINRARDLFVPKAQKAGISLMIINTGELSDARKTIMDLTENEGFDDMLVMVPFPQALEFGESMLGFNGCLNFFAGPTDTNFSAKINYYDVHYTERHIIGTTGGNVHDMREALELMAEDKIGPEVLITHIGGLDAVAEATLNLPKLPGGKKMIYTGISLPLTALDDLEEKGKESNFFAGLAKIVKKNNGLWSVEAETYLLEKADKI